MDMNSGELKAMPRSAKSFRTGLVRWCLAFLIPFLITFGLLVTHEKNRALDDIERNRPFGQTLGLPRDEIEAWKSGALFTVFLATPVGLLGLGGYGCYVGCRKLARRVKRS